MGGTGVGERPEHDRQGADPAARRPGQLLAKRLHRRGIQRDERRHLWDLANGPGQTLGDDPAHAAHGTISASSAAAAGVAVSVGPPARSTSSRVMRPPGPVPVNADRSTPRSLASFRTAGVAAAVGAEESG